jgi:hypothetical protein
LIRLSTVFSTLLLALWLVGGVQVHDVRFMLGALQTKKSSI